MSTRGKCAECGERANTRYEDPRDPPLEVFECLCLDCLVSVLDTEIEDKEQELEDLRAAQGTAVKLQQRRKR